MRDCLRLAVACIGCSLKLRSGVGVPLEGSVDDIGTLVDEVGHDWLVHGTVPWDISRLSSSVSVAYLVVLMEDWLLPGHPLSVSIWNWWVPWQHSADVPPVEIWVVQESSLVESVVVEYDWSLVTQTSADTLGHEEQEVCVGNPASDIEVLNWEFPDDSEAKEASYLSSSSVVSPVPGGVLGWSSDDIIHLTSWEPGLEDIKVLLGLRSPFWKPLLSLVSRQTEANKLVVLNVVSDLIVDDSSLSIIESVLLFLIEDTGVFTSIGNLAVFGAILERDK